jgi:hypothetical protein
MTTGGFVFLIREDLFGWVDSSIRKARVVMSF